MITPGAEKLSPNEVIKSANPTLAGTIASTLANRETDRFTEDDTQFLKFHGIYQQDDRDKRKTGKFFMFMVRGRMPGGVIKADQYLVFDDLATRHGNNTLRITTRQGFQFHGVVKSGLGPLMKGINDALMTTLAACGDVNRNVMSSATPSTSPLVDEVGAHARAVSDALLPKTRAYHSIWVEGKELDLGNEETDFVDPLYGKTYLPRKFKVAFAIPPANDIDIFTNCLGFIAIVENGKLAGYNLLAGGGMGMSHGNAETFPRLADVIGFITPDQVVPFSKAVLTAFRDYGDRTNRKHARLKYVLEDRGPDWFRQELEQRSGLKFQPARPYQFSTQADDYGWHKQTNGKNFLALFVENGRIKDEGQHQLKSALKQVAQQFQPEFRLTPNQNIILVDVADSDIPAINRVFTDHGIKTENQGSITRLASIACPALPTCGLALSDAERAMPDVITRIDALLAELGLQNQEIVTRMTGCPNGCARPYMAEIAFVGRAPLKYQVYLGGNASSTRLNRLWKENVKLDQIINELRPVLARFIQERSNGERFGDWCDRVLLPEVEAAKAAAATAPAPAAP